MRFTVSKAEIQEKLSDIKDIVVHDKTMPILSHFLLNISKDDSYIIATDLETTIKEPLLHIDLEAEGKLCIPARKLLEIVKEVEDEDLSFESAVSESPEPDSGSDFIPRTIQTVNIVSESPEPDSGSDKWLKVKSGNSKFKLACLPADDFPAWPALGDVEDITIGASTLMEMIEKTIYSAGVSDTRYTLNSLLFHLKPDKSRLRLVGTDGIRLAAVSKQVQTEIKEERKIIVSRKAIFGLKLLLGRAETVRISIGANHVLFSAGGDAQFLTRLVEGVYPEYEEIISKTNGKDEKKAYTVSVERDAFIKAMERVSVMSVNNVVKLVLTENLIALSSSDPNIGDAKDQVTADYKGDGIVIAFNARYLLDALKVMTADKVTLEFKDPLSPTLLTQQNDKVWKNIVMPVKI
jgi:DNA polymerase-3 subunit beta